MNNTLEITNRSFRSSVVLRAPDDLFQRAASTSAIIIDPFEQLTETTKFTLKEEFYAYIEQLEGSKYKIIKPLRVRVQTDFNEFIGSIDELDIYSFGDDYKEIINEIIEDIIELIEELHFLSDKQLGKKPLKWKKFLSEHVTG